LANQKVNTAGSGDSGGMVERTLTGSPILTVDNYTNSYFLAVSLESAATSFGINAARIGYTRTAFLPSILR
jgi:hypothetical protein